MTLRRCASSTPPAAPPSLRGRARCLPRRPTPTGLPTARGSPTAPAPIAGGDSLAAGNLAILPVTGPDSFGTPTVIHRATSVAGASEDSYPSWSPDSKWIAFQNGTDSKSDNQRPG